MRQWLGVLGELHRIVGAQRADAGDDRDMTRGFLHRSFDSAASFVASQIHINAGAAEQADGIDLSRDQPADQFP